VLSEGVNVIRAPGWSSLRAVRPGGVAPYPAGLGRAAAW